MINPLEWWLAQQLNSWVANSPVAFYRGLELSNRAPWLLAAVVLAGLWFVGEPGAIPTRPGSLTRLESRRRILLMLAALAISYLVTRLLQAAIFHPRPLVEAPLKHPIDPAVWQAVRDSLVATTGFPSFQAAMLFVIITGIFNIKAWAGYPALLAGAYFGALQVGLGFHWPIDVLAGALTGVLAASLTLVSLPLWRRLLTPIVLQFEYRQALAYPLGFLVLLGLAQQFAGLGSLLMGLASYALGR